VALNVVLTREGREIRAEVAPAGDGYTVTLDGRAHRVEGAFGGRMRVLIDGRPVDAAARRDGSDLTIELDGRAYGFRERDPRAPKLARRRGGEDATRGEVHAPMPGLIVEVLVEPGATVEAGQPIVIVEAMKMQNALVAPLRGRVDRVSVTPGTAVDTGQLLVTLRPEEG
jgi:3-methylcrotonyl-CoA carboxylase alpha subunit